MELLLAETELATGGQTGQAAWISKGLKVEETQYAIQLITITGEVELSYIKDLHSGLIFASCHGPRQLPKNLRWQNSVET